MKIQFVLFILMVISINDYSQDTVSVKKRALFSILAGAYHKTFLDCTYIEPTPFNNGDNFSKHQYERFNKVPTFGCSAGLLFTYKLDYQFSITSGILYYLRKEVFENSKDTVIKYGNGSKMRDIHNVMKYNYLYNDVELPLMLQYSRRRIKFFIGCNFSVISYNKTSYTYVVNQYPNFPQWISSDKTVEGWAMSLLIYPTIQMAYEFKINEICFNPFAAFNCSIKNRNELYVQLGLLFPLYRHGTGLRKSVS